MKRIIRNRKSKAVRSQALKLYRETREAIVRDHPDLLDAMRDKIQKAQAGESESAKMPKSTHAKHRKQQNPPPSNKPQAPALEEDMVHIDRNKNLQTILKYASENPGNAKLKETLMKMLN